MDQYLVQLDKKTLLPHYDDHGSLIMISMWYLDKNNNWTHYMK